MSKNISENDMTKSKMIHEDVDQMSQTLGRIELNEKGDVDMMKPIRKSDESDLDEQQQFHEALDDVDEFHDCLQDNEDADVAQNGEDQVEDLEEVNEEVNEEASEGAKEESSELTDDEYAKELESKMSEDELKMKKEEALVMKDEGNVLFKNGEYSESCVKYTYAVRHCPTCWKDERCIMFANRAAARIHLNMREKAIVDCNKAIELNPNYLKAILRRAQLLRESQDTWDNALSDYKRVLELDPGCVEAKVACTQMPIEINERNERMKTEMMGKLKDLGNVFLRPFGLSTENFKLQQNETGGYSINFQQQ